MQEGGLIVDKKLSFPATAATLVKCSLLLTTVTVQKM